MSPSSAGIPVGSAKIAPVGVVHLGRRLRLDQCAEAPVGAGLRFAPGLPNDGTIPAFENPMPLLVPGEIPRRQLSYRLVDARAELCLEGAGLTMSYGIFGAPGSGKTHLLMRILRQLITLDADVADRRFGALILDPKAALIEDIEETAANAGRSGDVVVLNADRLASTEAVNVIDCGLDSYELARALVLAGQSAGVAASEPYWFGAWENLFGGAIFLMRWLGEEVLTLRALVEAVLIRESDPLLSDSGERPVQALARRARALLPSLSPDERAEAAVAVNLVETFYAQEADHVATVENLVAKAYGDFLRVRTRPFCARLPKGTQRTTFYDEIVESGRLVLVSISPAEPGLAKVLCTLVKNLFMQTMRSRLDRVRRHELTNFVRPVVLACDEYSQIASEVPGQVGDGDFFSIARSQGCMGLLATQSVNVLQASSLKENWKSVFSNFGAKIFMRSVDNETTEEATRLAGELEWYEDSIGSSSGAQGIGTSLQRSVRERKVLPSVVLTQLIATGQGVVIGSLDGGATSGTSFLAVPEA